MKHRQVSMLNHQDTAPPKGFQHNNQSVKAVLVPFPAESAAKVENKEAAAKVKNPGEGKC